MPDLQSILLKTLMVTGGFVGLIVAAILILAGLSTAGVLWNEFRDTLKGAETRFNRNKPDEIYYSRDDPPWERPRGLYNRGSRGNRADFRLTMKRLTLVRAIEDPASYGPYGTDEPGIHVDEKTGQYWRLRDEEIGFNQHQVLDPTGPG